MMIERVIFSDSSYSNNEQAEELLARRLSDWIKDEVADPEWRDCLEWIRCGTVEAAAIAAAKKENGEAE